MISKLLVALVLCWGVQSFPDGAPIDTCVKERQNQPNHGQHRTQPISSLPYRVVASSMLFGPNTPITVTIEGAETFKGFFLQARSIDTDQWIGTWENAPNTTIHPECSSITHADPKEKLRAVLLWRAPPDAQGRVYFTGTVLKNYSTFWSNLIAEAPQDAAQLQILG
ncbi:putative defense protein 3 [Bombyx mandarina]|uniref:Reelin domain-containing protein n=2 Tax=Bombyx TaxID=7090 RepID=A0A8R2G749_BOMMO|nr:putative defense protein 3 [Bombyx mori]XP_028031079.1 putative defense protein 3 [Bombyx mandarina]